VEVKGDDSSIETVWLIGEGVGVEKLRKGDGGVNCVELIDGLRRTTNFQKNMLYCLVYVSS